MAMPALDLADNGDKIMRTVVPIFLYGMTF